MTLKCEGEGMKDIAALFAQRGEVGADGAEGLGASDGTETPGGLLLELWHADIAFGQIMPTPKLCRIRLARRRSCGAYESA